MKLNKNSRFFLMLASIITVVFGLVAAFVIDEEIDHIDNTYADKVRTIAVIMANDTKVIEKMENSDDALNQDMDIYYSRFPDLSSVIVLDMESKLMVDRGDMVIGETHYIDNQYNDLDNIFTGESYVGYYIVSGARSSMRSFEPVFDSEYNQIGVVSVAINNSVIQDFKVHKTVSMGLGFGLGWVVSLISMWWINLKFKSDLFGFTTSEIALLYAENKSIIEQLNEAVISVDKDFNIKTLNNTAIKMFNITEDAIGKKVHDVFPYCDFKRIITNDEHITNKYRKINEQKLLMNAFPLYLDGEIIGATAVFRSHLEVDSLLDQITGYHQLAEALRSQKHEFQNKLHVVLGLIKMKDYSKAENYIMENVYTTNLASDYYTSRLKDERILALFVGKEIQSKTLNAQLLLTSDSYLTKTHNPINSDDLVIVLGNLIDNSFEAYTNSDLDDKKIVVDIFEDEEKITMTVIDQAGGIEEQIIEHMFERGISSKNGESRGTGLSLVSEIVTFYNGEKNVYSSKEETKIEIILLKVSL